MQKFCQNCLHPFETRSHGKYCSVCRPLKKKEKSKKAHKIYYQRHRDEIIERVIAWRKEHPKWWRKGDVHPRTGLRFSTRQEANKYYIWQARLKIIEKLGGCCFLCEERDPRVLETHHWNGRITKRAILKKTEGGNPFKLLKDREDLFLLCANCHKRLHFKKRGRY